MDNIAGAPVEDDNFFGREAVVSQLQDILKHDDILLLGPRRIGKTSAARAVMARVRQDNWHSIEINVASCTDERGFLDKLDAALTPVIASKLTNIWRAVADKFSGIAGRIKSAKISLPGTGSVEMGVGEAQAEDWTQVANEALRLVAGVDEPWLIYVDELPIMLFTIIRNDPISGIQRVRRFLDWFRNDVRALPDANRVRWLVSGSVGLDTLVQEHGMADTINSMRHKSLDAFSADVAVQMLSELAKCYQLELSPANAAKIVELVQWPQPYYLQVVFNHWRTLIATKPGADPVDMIDAAVEQLAQPGFDNDFHHWEQRLELQLSKTDATYARVLLSSTARTPRGEHPEFLLALLQEQMPHALEVDAKRIFVRLRDILLRDAYWWADENGGDKRYRFRLEPLRRWWLRRDTL